MARSPGSSPLRHHQDYQPYLTQIRGPGPGPCTPSTPGPRPSASSSSTRSSGWPAGSRCTAGVPDRGRRAGGPGRGGRRHRDGPALLRQLDTPNNESSWRLPGVRRRPPPTRSRPTTPPPCSTRRWPRTATGGAIVQGLKGRRDRQPPRARGGSPRPRTRPGLYLREDRGAGTARSSMPRQPLTGLTRAGLAVGQPRQHPQRRRPRRPALRPRRRAVAGVRGPRRAQPGPRLAVPGRRLLAVRFAGDGRDRRRSWLALAAVGRRRSRGRADRAHPAAGGPGPPRPGAADPRASPWSSPTCCAVRHDVRVGPAAGLAGSVDFAGHATRPTGWR